MAQWWLEPLILIIFTALATQLGTKYAQSVLDDLRRNLDRHNYPDKLRTTLEKRADELEIPEGKAIDSFLNQVIATWGTVILTSGVSMALFVRQNAGAKGLAWLGLAIVVGGLILLSTFGLIRNASLLDYYNKQVPVRVHSLSSIIPPITSLTLYRILTFIIYAILVFGSYWPGYESNSDQAKDKMATPTPTTVPTPTPSETKK